MKRYLTIDEETLKKCLRATDEACWGFGNVCDTCPVRDSDHCVEHVEDPCWLSVYNWLTEDVPDRQFYSAATQIYNDGYDSGWNDGRRQLVKQIEEKVGIIRKERDRK